MVKEGNAMFGIVAGLTLIAIGIAWRLHQRKIARSTKMSRAWVLDDLPEHQKAERRRMAG